jgi:hypothetical protein
MNRKTAIVVGACFFVAALVGAAGSGCSKSDNNSTRSSQKGEACQTTNDCASGLSCVRESVGGGVCVIGQFKVPSTSKECVVVECSTPSDCCVPPLGISPMQCAFWEQGCADGGFNAPTDCQNYNTYCKCDTSKWTCSKGACGHVCTSNTDCTGSLPYCSNGACVQCMHDTDCPASGDTCQMGVCQPPCMSDGDCPAFNRCNNGGCVESGCQTDRECVAYTRHVDATCGGDGKCIVPCQTDLECGNPADYDFYSCIQNSCTYVGCSTDKDCELSWYYTHGPDAGLPSSHSHFSCRDKM